MPIYDISYTSLIFCFFLLAIPIFISWKIRLELEKSTLEAVFRMSIQLFLAGIFLNFIFNLNNGLLNLAWVGIMIFFASYTAIKSVDLNVKKLFAPIILAIAFSSLAVLLYFNKFVINLENLLEARYLIPIAGMFLGNSLRGNVVGIGDFYSDIKRNENRYLYSLSLGAGMYEAVLPYLRKSLRAAVKPTLANIASVGIVTLPGMMTGQILGGASPLVAIKYQITIMIAQYVSTLLGTTLSILTSFRTAFDEYGLVNTKLYEKNL
ncbi:MAG: ABC transporter permease [Methanosarcina vacuolata]|jgi:putative ABC transport system permease protein|uniref:YbbM seven transmembrane helix protein n=1 Tax=Methanosarcina vacuolata Z-761 TaxID=1434123 RepID=A0A0E3Q1I4_9EURY|nr:MULTISPECIES: ABC transporter permease [Methanosarcina]AKB43039.1 YbbM seven transmembrane helix protein [Methanosarcina vacuolata Z-761]AKB46532.1 YbbM seven transmembrane helix protein [Methanosarcina sp. Kolksee]MDY0129745.1 ABC transporter permease [Methanosarcina vacuolata]